MCSLLAINLVVVKPSQVLTSGSPTPLMSVSDYSPKSTNSSLDHKYTLQEAKNPGKMSKWTQFVESIEKLGKEYSVSSESQSFEGEEKEKHYQDKNFLPKIKSNFDFINRPSTSHQEKKGSELRTKTKMSSCQLLKSFELPKLPLPVYERKEKRVSPTALIEENLFKFVTSLPKRRSSTPTSLMTFPSKHMHDLRSSGAKTDSENGDSKKRSCKKKQTKILCETPENIIITKTAPSFDRFSKYSSSSTEDIFDRNICRSETPSVYGKGKYSLIDYKKMPSQSYEALKTERRDERFISQNVYLAGKIVAGGWF